MINFRRLKAPKAVFGLVLLAVILLAGSLWAYSGRDDSDDSPADNASVEEESADKEEQVSKPQVDHQLEALLASLADQHVGDFSISLREITGQKRTASFNGNESRIAASNFKPYLSFASLRQVEEGRFGLQTIVPTKGMTVEQCIDQMLLRSLSACSWRLGSLTGWGGIQQTLEDQGYQDTNINNYDHAGNFIDRDKMTTTNDLAQFLVELESGELLSEQHTRLMLSRMEQQVWRERIPAGLPNGAKTANKPGWIYDVQNDAGIIYDGDNKYALAIMSSGAAVPSLADITKEIHDYLF